MKREKEAGGGWTRGRGEGEEARETMGTNEKVPCKPWSAL